MRVKAIVSYDGSDFCGYQIQPNDRTVQGEIEKALYKLHKGQSIKVQGSGRTDAGVHAVGQVIHFDTTFSFPENKWPIALNVKLPNDVVIMEASYVDDDFHARYGTTAKEYRYRISRRSIIDVFDRKYSYHYPYPLDLFAIREACIHLCGTHDFSSFCVTNTGIENKVRTIHSIDILEEASEIIFCFKGNGFLYNMVRIIVGTLLDVGRGKIKPTDIPTILAGRDRNLSGKTAPAHGLFLWEVHYDN